MTLRFLSALSAAGLLAFSLAAPPLAAQMKSGDQMKDFDAVFGVRTDQRTYPFNAVLVESSAPGNILFPGEQPKLTLQIVNNEATPLSAEGEVRVIAYGTRGLPGDVWLPELYRAQAEPVETIPVQINAGPKGRAGFCDITISPKIPARFGGYAVMVDIKGKGSRFATSLVRTFAATTERIEYPKMSLDYSVGGAVLQRLGVQAVRLGVGYMPSTDPHYQAWCETLRKQMDDLRAHNITALLEFGAGDAPTPLGRSRPHLDDNAVMLKTKSDMAWLPSADPDFQKVVESICAQYGWPKGPLTAVSLWNEPWEGISISGWGADMLRFREIYTAMADGVLAARKSAGVNVLLGGCDSSSNTWDKLFPDGKDTFLPLLDVVTLHYQGLNSPVLYKPWRDRTGPEGRVQLWDTESWVANTDDRVATVISGFRAAGYDRSMGIFGGDISNPVATRRLLPNGKAEPVDTATTWSLAAAVGAEQHFIGERGFRDFLFQNGLPWIFVFNGTPAATDPQDDGTVVVCGDLSDAFGNADELPFRTASPTGGFHGRLTLPADPAFRLYDFYGNLVTTGGTIDIPLDNRGFYLRTDGSSGSFERLLAALRTAHIAGYPPLAPVVHDPVAPVDQGGVIRLTLTNILNRPVTGALAVTVPGLALDYPKILTFAPGETKDVGVRITSGTPRPDNTYALALTFDAGADGRITHDEAIHVDCVARRTITVDGDLADWKGVLPQTVSAAGDTGPTLTERAWLPFEKFDTATKAGLATAWLACDSKYFYFAAKVAGDNPDPGTYRFADLPADDFFYPEVSYELDPDKTFVSQTETWDAPPRDNAALVLPGAQHDERSHARWISEASAIAVDMNLPADHATQVGFYFVDTDNYQNGRARIVAQVTDRKTGHVLAQHTVTGFGFGTYALFDVSGDVRVVFRSQSWLPASLSGIFLDAAPGTASATPAGASARFLRLDETTGAHWAGHYGAEGFYVIGTEAHFPSWAKIAAVNQVVKKEYHWPEGVRRFSYREKPVLPCGSSPAFDNVQIAFGVRAPGEGDYNVAAPGTMPGFVPDGGTTDYEYALNKVAKRYGGGTEIWRLAYPGMPPKDFYPRQPKGPFDGAVKGGKLVIRQEGNTRIVECAIPWGELPLVKAAVDAGKPVRFTFRVNYASGPGMELATGRSTAAQNNAALHPSWIAHWSNSIEFGFQKAQP